MSHVQLKTVDDTQELFLYGVLGDVFDGATSGQFARELKNADTSKPLRVRINSVGGLVNEGMAMYTALMLWDGEVTTHNDALVASAATLPFLAGDTRIMAEGSKFHVHSPWLMTVGPVSEHEKSIRELNVYEADMVAIYEKRAELGEKEIRAMMDADTPINAADAVDGGWATEASGDAAVAACIDKTPQMALFLNEARIAAWAPLLGDDPPEAPTEAARGRESLRISLELTRAKYPTKIIA